MQASQQPGAGGTPDPSTFHLAIVGWYVLLVVHAMRRHRVRLFLVWFAVVAISVGLMEALPKTYEVKTTLQAQRAQVIAALSGRAIPESEVPTKQAAETVLRRENLISLIEKTHLIEVWPTRRAPLLRIKDAIWARLFRPPTHEELIDGFVGYLETRLWVATGEGTVTIGIRFPDPELAYQLVGAALDNFLEARNSAALSGIVEAITILEARGEKAHQALNEARKQLQKLRDTRASRLGTSRPRRTAVTAVTNLPDQDTSQLLLQAETKRQAIASLEEDRRRKVAALEAKLQEQRALYSEPHPAVLDIRANLDAARKESAELQAMRQELAPLETELEHRGFNSNAPLKLSRAREIALQAAALEPDDPREDEDADIQYTKAQVRHALARYNDILDRIESARLEQDTAGAAFKYRYTVIWPAQLPRGPIQPKPELILLAGLVAGLFLGILAATLADVQSRKVVEPWQVEHALGIPLLAEMRQAADVGALWHPLMVRPWVTLAVVAPGDAASAWEFAGKLGEVAAQHQFRELKVVDARDATQARANALAHAVTRAAIPASNERLRFVIAVDSPLRNPVAIGILIACDAVLLFLDQGKTLIPDALGTVDLAGRHRVIGAVLRRS